MIRVTPQYAAGFRCTASQCQHSCCVGWEIDIDGDTLAEYDRVPGAFGARLRSQIDREPTPHFRLGESDRCPFLNESNLCEIILTRGEGALCQICADHPRFFNWFPDRMELGLGLCCEEAARRLLTAEHPLALTAEPLEEPEEEGEEGYFRLLERRDEVLDLLGDVRRPLSRRMESALALHGLEPPAPDPAELIGFLQTLEHLDPAWAPALAGLAAAPGLCREAPVPELEEDGGRLLCYLVYRYYLPWGLTRWEEEFPLKLGCAAVTLLRGLYRLTLREKGVLTLADRAEWLRLWSGEIEYSEENLEALAEWLR